MAAAAVIIGAIAVGIVGGLQVTHAVALLDEADEGVRTASRALREGDTGVARDALETVSERAVEAEESTYGLAAPLRGLPVVGDDIAVVRTAARAASDIADSALLVLRAVLDVGSEGLLPAGGRMRLEAFAALRSPLDAARIVAEGAAESLASAEEAGLSERAREGLRGARRQAEELTTTLAVLGDLLQGFEGFLGRDGARRYFVAALNPAESRGGGGLMGAFAIAEISDGRLHIGGFHPIQDLPELEPDEIEPPTDWYSARYDRFGGAGRWRSLNLTADFPTTGAAILNLYEAVEGERLDGVIAVDPFALQRLSRLTGPLDVPRIGEVPANRIVPLLANEAFGALSDPDERKDLLGDVAAEALQRFLRGDIDDPIEAIRTLVEMARDRHVMLHSRRGLEQAAFRAAGIAGALGEDIGDFAGVVTNNASANKVDFYVDRSIEYVAVMQPDGVADSVLTVTFRNEAPTSGPPSYVIGPATADAVAGQLNQHVDLICARACTLQDSAVGPGFGSPRAEMEGERPTHLTFGRLHSGDESWAASVRSVEDAWRLIDVEGQRYAYDLRLAVQTTPRPTQVRIELMIPTNMRVTRVSPQPTDRDGRRLVFERASTGGPYDITVEFTPDLDASAADRVSQ